MQINIIGQILDSSGYAVHTRQLANALSKLVDVRLTTTIPQGAERLLSDKEVSMIKKKLDQDAINLVITNPMYWKLYTTQKRNWVFLVFEGDKIPKSWLLECLNEDIEYIFVPSEHTKQAVMKTFDPSNRDGWMESPYTEQIFRDAVNMKNKIKVIPHGVDLNLFYPKEKT